jgi:hypothetical protein
MFALRLLRSIVVVRSTLVEEKCLRVAYGDNLAKISAVRHRAIQSLPLESD